MMLSGITILFEPLKNKQNQKGCELFPWMKRLVDESKDKLYTAAKLAIIGNSLDLLWSEGSVDVEPIIESKLRLPLNEDNYVAFKNRVKKKQVNCLSWRQCRGDLFRQAAY